MCQLCDAVAAEIAAQIVTPLPFDSLVTAWALYQQKILDQIPELTPGDRALMAEAFEDGYQSGVAVERMRGSEQAEQKAKEQG